jgi:Fe-S cluster assembly protein SufD
VSGPANASGVDERTRPYVAQYGELAGRAAAAAPWLGRIREAALARFTELGFPTPRQEEWKYTSVEPIARTSFARAPEGSGSWTAADVERLLAEERPALLAVFVNGRFVAGLSRATPGVAGARVGSLREMLERDPGRLEEHLARYASFERHPFAALNTAFIEDGAYVEIPPRQVIAEPIHLLFLADGGPAPTVSHPRVLVVAGQSSQATIVETYAGGDRAAYFTNSVSEVIAGPDSRLDHYRLQREGAEAFHVAVQQFYIGRDADLSTHSIALGGALVRNNVHAVLDGEGANCTLNGLFLRRDAQHIDNQTRIEHVRPHGSSRELYKGILAGRARGAFNGRIVVRPGAQKTDAKQTNKNILLSSEALMDSNPQLEIYADDVKCTHGSTTGQVDEEAVFYLRSRGIDWASARAVLVYAFAGDIIQRVRVEPLRRRLDADLHAWLPAAVALGEAA